MRVVDTSAWIEWLVGSATGRSLAERFPQPEHHVVPTIVQMELAFWAMREISDAYADRVVSETRRYSIAPMNTKIAIRAASVRREHKLATADAIIYATAIEHHADLLTCDAHFKDLPHVVYVSKFASQ